MTRRPFVAPSLALGALLVAAPLPAQGPRLLGEPLPPVSASAPAPAAASPSATQRWFGSSGKLRAAIVQSMDLLDFPFLSGLAGADAGGQRWTPLFAGARDRLLGEPAGAGAMRAPAEPGIWRLEVEQAYLGAAAGGRAALDVITRVPFSRKKGNYLNGYHVGRYPTEGSGRNDRYAPPPGFIEITRENQDFQISEHFRLRQFLTKDQHNVWPKYLVLDVRLIDKLELVLQELNAMGVRADRMHVMSGFRTPQYNGPGGNGRARLSRHTYGDAADVWVDNDSDGYMDDLNGDGRRDMHDARVMLNAVDRVEAKHPELVGGAGLYPDNGAHGPFIHIDTRGSRSRW
jgi:uncharacterized protein YcbK (DUF882 family)